MGVTKPGQMVTPENIAELPAGSVIRNGDGSRIIHLHDRTWLWCCDHAWYYDNVDHMKSKLDERSVACHIHVVDDGSSEIGKSLGIGEPITYTDLRFSRDGVLQFRIMERARKDIGSGFSVDVTKWGEWKDVPREKHD